MPDLFAEQKALPDSGFAKSVGSLSKYLKTHDLLLLLIVGGLYDAYLNQSGNTVLLKAKTMFFRYWNESYRYAPHPLRSDADVLDLINIIENPINGLLVWIRKT